MSKEILLNAVDLIKKGNYKWNLYFVKIDRRNLNPYYVCQTAHCGRGKSHFIFGGLASPMVPYRNLPQAPDGMIADCCSLV